MTFTVTTSQPVLTPVGNFPSKRFIALSYQNTKYLLEERRASLQERSRDLENQCQGAVRLLANTNTAINSTWTFIFSTRKFAAVCSQQSPLQYMCSIITQWTRGMSVDTDEQSIHSNSSSQKKSAALVSSEINRCDINTRAAEERTVLQAGLDSAVIWLMNHLC